jgi:hypothetical protein
MAEPELVNCACQLVARVISPIVPMADKRQGAGVDQADRDYQEPANHAEAS